MFIPDRMSKYIPPPTEEEKIDRHLVGMFHLRNAHCGGLSRNAEPIAPAAQVLGCSS